MTSVTVQIPVDDVTAARYQNASSEEQTKVNALLGVWLRELSQPSRSLSELMDEVSDKAEARGLTDERLAELLSDE